MSAEYRPPMVPPLRRGDVDFRLRGNDGAGAGRRIMLVVLPFVG